MNNLRAKYDAEHKHFNETVFQCSTCERLECFKRVPGDNSSSITKCRIEVPEFPLKVDQDRCKKYKLVKYNGYSY